MTIDIDRNFVRVAFDQGDLPPHFERNQLAALFHAAADWIDIHVHGDVVLHDISLNDFDDGKSQWPVLVLYVSDDSRQLREAREVQS